MDTKTQPTVPQSISDGTPTSTIVSNDAMRLYQAANRIALLEYQLKCITEQRDDLIGILKKAVERL